MIFLQRQLLDSVFPVLIKVKVNSLFLPINPVSRSRSISKKFVVYYFQQRTFSKVINPTQLKMPSQVSSRKTITISVDGNISSGKSTLVSNLEKLFPNDFNLQVELVPEPLEKWTNVRGHNLLGMFYEDLTRNNFMFQHYVQLTRLMSEIKKPEELTAGRTGKVKILERSLQNNRYCFTELARSEGRLTPEEFAVLAEWHSWLEKKFDLTLDAIVYLRTDPQTVYNRMQKRGRSEESTVPMGYLKSLHETYEQWLIKEQVGCISSSSSTAVVQERLEEAALKRGSTGSSLKQRVIVIDGNQSIEQVAEECRCRLKTFMKEIGHEDQNLDKSSLQEKENGVCHDTDALA